MKKADKDKLAKAIRDGKGKPVRVETLLPVKWKKKVVGSITRKDGKR